MNLKPAGILLMSLCMAPYATAESGRLAPEVVQ